MPELSLTIPETPKCQCNQVQPKASSSFLSRFGTKPYIYAAFFIGFATGIVTGRASK
jgi:hypothetical protein